MTAIGATSVPRIDGEAILAGNAGYTIDLLPIGAAHVALVRSPMAHGRICTIEAKAAAIMPGVLGIFTADDLAQIAKPYQPSIALPPGVDGRGPLQSHCLADGEVCFVGQPVVAVVAETGWDAEAAALKVMVEYDRLPAMLDAETAFDEGATISQPGWTTNLVAVDRIIWGDVETALTKADVRVSGEMTIHPSVAAPMETLCYCAEWHGDALTAIGSFQNPHTSRALLATALDLPLDKVRVIAGRLGGTFGFKMAGHPEELLVAALSRALGRPVAYTESRADNLGCSASRTQRHRYEISATQSGRLTAFRNVIVADVGVVGAGYGWSMAMVTGAVFPTVYEIPNGQVSVRLAATNKAPWQPIRGYGKEVSNLVMEAAMDRLATTLCLDPVELRRRNLIPKDAFPRRLPSGYNVDSGDYPGALAQLSELFDYSTWRQRQGQQATGDERIGVGFIFELTPEGGVRPGIPGNTAETAIVRISKDGGVTVATGVTSPGGGNETGIAQLTARALGIAPAGIRVIQGDTAHTPLGMGNASSKGLVFGGMAAYLAANKLADMIKTEAARLWNTDAARLTLSEERVADPVSGRDVTLAALVEQVGPLEAAESYSPSNVNLTPDPKTGRISTYPSYPYAAHAAAIALDGATGRIRLLDYACVHDCGTIINPMLVESQLKGAINMGIGVALWEEARFAADGAPIADRFKAYHVPRMPDLPPIRLGHRSTPSPFHPLGMKGAGESGIGGAIAAVTSAVADAMRGLGAELEAIPATPERVLTRLSRIGAA